MTPASEILRMIEGVSPDDAVKLAEIDMRGWCLTEGYVYDADDKNGFWQEHKCPQYTRSRDALKSIRPEGWEYLDLSGHYSGHFTAYMSKTVVGNRAGESVRSPFLCSEELAELHCIIQAIEFERTKEET